MRTVHPGPGPMSSSTVYIHQHRDPVYPVMRTVTDEDSDIYECCCLHLPYTGPVRIRQSIMLSAQLVRVVPVIRTARPGPGLISHSTVLFVHLH